MTKHTDKNIRAAGEMLQRECRGLSSCQTIEHLFTLGLLSNKRCKAYLAKRLVAERTRQGMTKMDALEATAVQMNCSFATVRNYYYYNFKD